MQDSRKTGEGAEISFDHMTYQPCKQWREKTHMHHVYPAILAPMKKGRLRRVPLRLQNCLQSNISA